MRIDETPGTATRSEQRVIGIGLSPGMAIGTAYIGDRGELPVSESRIEDTRAVGARLIRNLLKRPYIAYSGLSGGAIILAEEVTPADTALMDPHRIGGFAAEFGGQDSHTAIMARALGLPAVLGVAGLL